MLGRKDWCQLIVEELQPPWRGRQNTEGSLSYNSMVRRLPAHILEYGQAEQREFPNKLAVSISPFYKFEVPTCVLVPSTCRVVPSSLVNSPWAPSQTNPKVWLTNHFNPRELVVKASPQNVHYSAAPSASLALIWFGQGGLWPRLYDSSSLKHVFLSWAWGSLFQASFSLKSVLKPCLKTIVLPSHTHLPVTFLLEHNVLLMQISWTHQAYRAAGAPSTQNIPV